MEKTKVIIIQRVCPHYIVPLFQRLSQINNINLIVYYGQHNRRGTKLKNAKHIRGFKTKRLFTLSLFLKFKDRLFPVFINPMLIFHLFRDRPNLIICEGESNLINNLSVAVFVKLTKTPYIWWGLGRVRSRKPSIFRKLFYLPIQQMLRNASAILAYSNFAKKFYSTYNQVDQNKVFVAYNCVDTEKVLREIEKYKPLVMKEKEKLGLVNKRNILFVGSFGKSKKIENLILAYQIIKKQYSDVSLLLVGDGKIKKEMENLVKTKQVKDVIFTGSRIEDVSLYFLMGDVFVLPGEGGLAINQAMIHGLPIVTVPADGTELDMVINGKNGYIVDNDNVEVLAQAILKILTNKELRKNMSDYSQFLIQKYFNIHNMVNTIVNCINFCLLKEK